MQFDLVCYVRCILLGYAGHSVSLEKRKPIENMAMVFVVLQIRRGTTVLKGWYGCCCPDTISLADVYTPQDSWTIRSPYLSPEDCSAPEITCQTGKQRHDLEFS